MPTPGRLHANRSSFARQAGNRTRLRSTLLMSETLQKRQARYNFLAQDIQHFHDAGFAADREAPARWPARAVAASPSGWNRICAPAGARITGNEMSSPTTVTWRLTSGMGVPHPRAQGQPAEA